MSTMIIPYNTKTSDVEAPVFTRAARVHYCNQFPLLISAPLAGYTNVLSLW